MKFTSNVILANEILVKFILTYEIHGKYILTKEINVKCYSVKCN